MGEGGIHPCSPPLATPLNISHPLEWQLCLTMMYEELLQYNEELGYRSFVYLEFIKPTKPADLRMVIKGRFFVFSIVISKYKIQSQFISICYRILPRTQSFARNISQIRPLLFKFNISIRVKYSH